MLNSENRTLSIVTVTMNRTDHIVECAQRVSKLDHHLEHIIVDWSSKDAIPRSSLPDDARIRLIRVEGETRWCMPRACNFAMSFCRGTFFLKLDADQLISDEFLQKNPVDQHCFRVNDLTVGDHFYRSSTGLLFCPTQFFWKIGGYNEYLVGWGYEDIDLYARLRGYLDQKNINTSGLSVIHHSDERRVVKTSDGVPAYATKQFAHEKNQWIAKSCVWNADIPRSTYIETNGDYRAEYIPALPPFVQERLDFMTQWHTLDALSHVRLEPSSFERMEKSYSTLMTKRGVRCLWFISLIPRVYARLINKLLGM